MSTRYALSTASLLAGIVLLVTSRVFTGGTLEWTAFGLGTGVLVLAVAGLVLGTERRHLAGFGVLAAVSVWTLVSALVFTGGTLGWIAFADAVAIATIALGALTIHEVSTERVVHTLEVRDDSRELQTV
ncbi:hypothetical protein [Jatrophihabitans endophyticus]|uniref:hypothetical protein n=1 Tax=Jatrophihabitans endophyticus TaxID=1206085 RepID=UPI001A0DCF9B|nr:hypothetical protein [Jatrophihabitans endophyticus]MBE7186728.1 hypothetical protein [Jatrophihabitans endophyticus]